MQCVILAGGLGTRIAGVAAGLPKTLIPVEGRPFACHQLELLARAGIRRVIYSTGYKGEAIRQYIGSGERWGLEVSYVDEGNNLRGTAGALRLALDSAVLAPSFFVLYGDSYLPIDYAAVWRAFETSGKDALMTVFRNERRWDTSNVLFENGLISLYDKHRRDPRSERMVYIDYGLTALRRTIVEAYIAPDQVSDLADVYHCLSIEGQLAGYEVTERFYEIGSPSGLEDFRRRVAQAENSGSVTPSND